MGRETRPAAKALTIEQILRRLRKLGDPRVRAAMLRFGVRAKRTYGVAAPALRRLAREIGTHHELALQLWATGIHEARALAGLLGDPARVTARLMDCWARDFDSWDVVDGSCCHLFVFARPAWKKAIEWSRSDQEYVKRAGFSLMAYLAVHDEQASDARFARLLAIIRREAADERHFVKKAVNWALRQIGKRNRRLNRLAIQTARQIRASHSPTARWIAADALRELTGPAVQGRLGRSARRIAR